MCNNTKTDKGDKFCKVRLVIKDLNEKVLKFSLNGENKSIDESMVFTSALMEVDRESIINQFVWVISFGFSLKDQGAKVGKQIAFQTKWGIGEMVVLRLMECLPPNVNYHVYMDNYFTSFHLLAKRG